MSTVKKMNRLAGETSPYLLQHATNPVDWYPWGDEAIQRARTNDQPIFLSIGYSACHWCHVMEHESFENAAIAESLNLHFVCIKVDREERPDLDQIYMTAVQLLTGRGGWPMSVFLTPSLQPFFGGTYWPPEPKMGMPGFRQVLLAVVDAWTSRRDQAIEQAERITQHIDEATHLQPAESSLDTTTLLAAAAQMEKMFDFTYGGFGGAPKFPHSMNLECLLRVSKRTGRPGPGQMVRLNLDKMAAGGIYDQLAGGFARYSVDQQWLVPHFEKMLYDNALLANVYLDAHSAIGNPLDARIVTETLHYVLNYMTDSEGGFHSTEDADSEGVEGKFYVWSRDEIKAILGDDAAERFCYVYDVSENGNFEESGKSILNLPKSIEQCATIKGWSESQLHAELESARAKLLVQRDQRIRPGKDDKVLASWNGLMIRAMARAGAVLEIAEFTAAAEKAAKFILQSMRGSDGRLLHSWRNGQAKLDGYLEDYACLALGLIALYEATFDEAWIDHAMDLVKYVKNHFSDGENAGFFFTSDDHSELITRIKDMHDNATPCANAVMASVLVRLGRLSGNTVYVDLAEKLIHAASGVIERAPLAAGQWLVALDELLGPSREIVLVGGSSVNDRAAILRLVRQRFEPNTVVLLRDSTTLSRSKHLDKMFQGRTSNPSDCTAYICQGATCEAPIVGREAILVRLGQLGS